MIKPLSNIGIDRQKYWQKLLRKLLPEDKTFWYVYAPVIRILKDSNEHRKIREKIDRYFDLNQSDVVLEEGCGNAVWLSEIESRVSHTIGLDVEQRMLEVAMGRAPRSLFVQANLNQGMPFKEEQFTKIGSILVDGYLREQDLPCQERFRVLKPGGMLAIVTPKKGAKFFKVLVAEARQRKEEQTFLKNLKRLPLAIVAVIFGKIAELKAVVGDWHFHGREELIEKYSKAGFEIVACELVYADQAWLLIVRKPKTVLV